MIVIYGNFIALELIECGSMIDVFIYKEEDYSNIIDNIVLMPRREHNSDPNAIIDIAIASSLAPSYNSYAIFNLLIDIELSY